MKILSRDFTKGEKALILILALVLLALGYYQFVDRPVRSTIESAQSEAEALEVELLAVNRKVADLERMQNELDTLRAAGSVSLMPSYNANKAELDILNDVLSGTSQYNISFPNVTRSGDQIRRNFTLTFTVPDYDAMKTTIAKLADSEYRCLIDDIRVSTSGESDRNTVGSVSVTATATFYETMVGGIEDAGLPSDS